MKKLLGALVAALALGVGCAHDQEKTARTEVPSVGQGQAGGSVAQSGLNCEVISTGGSGAAGAAAQEPNCVPDQASTSASQSSALGGSASQDEAIGGSATQDEAIGGSASEDLAIGGSASENAAIGGSASQNLDRDSSASQNVGRSGSASKERKAGDQASDDAAFENTDMGGTGGGGG